MNGHLDVHAAVKTAKTSLLHAFDGENPQSLRLEEIRLDDTTWKVTISFSRGENSVAAIRGARTFKVVQINDLTGGVVAITHRNINADAPS